MSTVRESVTRELCTDVCVIGAGPAGVTVALRLAEAGIDVVLIEAGRRGPGVNDSDGPSPVEVRGAPYPVHRSRSSGLGGTARIWDGWNPDGEPLVRLGPVRPEHLEERSWFGSAGWPVCGDELDRYVRIAADRLGVMAPEWDAPLHQRDVVRHLTGSFVARTLRFAPRSTMTTGLVSRLLDSRVSVLTRARVVRLDWGAPGPAVRRVAARTDEGASIVVEALTFVLATGGIENPRQLLMAAGPDGGGAIDPHHLVGRHFMEHPHRQTAVISTGSDALDELDIVRQDVGGTPGEVWLFTDPDESRRRAMGSVAFAIRSLGSGDWARGRYLRSPAEAPGALGEVVRRSLACGESPERTDVVRAAMRDPVRASSHLVQRLVAELQTRRRRDGERLYGVMMMAEQKPVSHNRVALSSRRDADGLPLARLEFELDAATLESIRSNNALLVGDLRRALGGGVHCRVSSYRSGHGFGWGYHHMGTTRMHPDPSRGVVDDNCRVHGLDNLYVAGSSVFASSGVTNPTLTIVALALRLADHLATRLGAEVDPGSNGSDRILSAP